MSSRIFLFKKYERDGSLNDQLVFSNDFNAMMKRFWNDAYKEIPLIKMKVEGKNYTNSGLRKFKHFKAFMVTNTNPRLSFGLIEYKEDDEKKEIQFYNDDVLIELHKEFEK